MENNETKVDTETTNTEVNTEVETTVAEKTFTQKEFDEALQRAIARKTKNIPSDEEIKSFNEWKESKKTESEKIAEREKEYQQTLTEKEELKRENMVLKKGVNPEDVEFIVFKVSKMEGEFEDNLKDFLESNSKFTETKKEFGKATGTQTNNSANVEKESGVNALLRAKHPELFN